MRVQKLPSIISGGRSGVLFKMRDMFDFVRRIDALWNRCLAVPSSSEPLALARDFPSFVIWNIVASWRPPSVSKGRGMKAMPSVSHNS